MPATNMSLRGEFIFLVVIKFLVVLLNLRIGCLLMLGSSQQYIKWESFKCPIIKIMFYCLATPTNLPSQSIRVPLVTYLLVFDLNGLWCSKSANKITRFYWDQNIHEFLDWCHNKVDFVLNFYSEAECHAND